MAAAPEEQKLAALPQAPAVAARVKIHALQLRRICKSEEIGTLLVHSQGIETAPIQHGEVRRDDDMVRRYAAAVAAHRMTADIARRRVLIDREPGQKRRKELKRVKPRLLLKADGFAHRKGKLGGNAQVRRSAEIGGICHLALQRGTVRRSVDVGRRGGKIARNALSFNQFPVLLDGVQICLHILPRKVYAEILHQLLTENAVLCGDLCRRARGGTAGKAVLLQKNDAHALLMQEIRGQNACDAAADHGSIGVKLLLQPRIARQLRTAPRCLHAESSLNGFACSLSHAGYPIPARTGKHCALQKRLQNVTVLVGKGGKTK